MIRQCRNCGAFLPPERRSPLCLPCWTNHQRVRRRNNVRVFRQRTREQAPPADEERPNGDDFSWLDDLGLDLVDLAVELLDLDEAGVGAENPRWVGVGREVLRRYDANRAEFDRRAALQADPNGRADLWRGFFEAVREALK